MSQKNWKQLHADESDKAISHPIVEGVVDEQMRNLSNYGVRPLDQSLLRYSLLKVAMYAAQVSRAQCLGFDPNALRLTPEEANAEMIQLAERIVMKASN